MSHDYQGIIVSKPWGYEYLMYQNEFVAIWYLCIKQGAQTSLHCHPHKKTGLILLSGEAVVRFLNGSTSLKALTKLMIRQGLFHSTLAVSPEGIMVIEVESPPHKTDLVRLEDEYGRKEKPYEGSEAMIPKPESCIRLNRPQKNKQFKYSLQSCLLTVEKIEDISHLIERPKDEIIVVLEGGLFSREGEYILGPGDVVTFSTLNRLAETFPAPYGVSLLTIQKEEKICQPRTP